MKPKILGLLTIFLITGLNVSKAQDKKIQYPDTKDLHVLIYSTSHSPTTQTSQHKGVLNLQISAFSTIIQVDINGETIDHPGGTSFTITYPYSLNQGENEFVVTVITDEGMAQQRYSITLDKERITKKKPFQLVGILSASSMNNVNNASDSADHESATKSSLVLVPIYDIDLDATSLIKLKAIVLRDKYSSGEHAAMEVAYTQAAAQWVEQETALGQVYAEAGVNDIKTDNSNILTGTDDSASEVFIGGGLNRKIDSSMSWSLEAAYKLVDSKTEFSNSGDDKDGGAFDLTGKFYINPSGIKGTGKLNYGFYDAQGDYKDSSSAELGIKAVYPLDPWIPSLELSVKNKTMTNEDPRKGVAQADQSTTYQIKMAYGLFPNLQLALSYKSKTVSSNVDTAAYTGTTIKFTAIYVY